MTDTIEILLISVLACTSAYLWTKQRGPKPNSATLPETTPLLTEKEQKLEAGMKLLLEEKIKQESLQEEFKGKIKEFDAKSQIIEKKEAELAENSALLKEQLDRASKLESRTSEIEARETKLNESLRLLEEERSRNQTLEATVLNRMKDVEAREAELEKNNQLIQAHEAKLQEDKGLLEEERVKNQNLETSVQNKMKEVETREAELEKSTQSMKLTEAKLQEDQRLLDEAVAKNQNTEKSLLDRMKEVEKREAELKAMEAKAREVVSAPEETAVPATEEASTSDDAGAPTETAPVAETDKKAEEPEPVVVEDEEPKEPSVALEDAEPSTTPPTGLTEDEVSGEPEEPAALSDEPKKAETVDDSDDDSIGVLPELQSEFTTEKRKALIEEEINNLVKQANENELEPEYPFDEDSIDALMKAAMEICYRKKYYDVMQDKLIYFPTPVKTIIDYRLMETAEKYLFEGEEVDDDDEYPQDLSIAIRSVAFGLEPEAENEEDMDEEYMMSLALDVNM
mmetsp:Transcript_15911/g.32615  ORF Transcript_15911/g.32615 Transcript_15911/m.32615 type:complete len:512 (+) Transcript_15911:184-1719(+)|eukprot:CAMPEP_0201137550 /NCGR_PEP_ID=MMETSP0850-20130426/55468_1 /ASSEMBLY_ACC=CAM_ASM_000622 /TAXON_ID=183588 /ORGANISM="Pseudo-nitzschia fraudulenta, Strain WWA7" /LENGTH=511 /DNA_ID=CAMNT_0047408909 /DNA_START=222 /DNA_END=1757 /DNA_ORIENTATION=-